MTMSTPTPAGPMILAPATQLAERVMKARTESICPRCKCPVGVGVQIGLIPGVGWCHVRPCIIGGTMPMIGPSNEPTDSVRNTFGEDADR